MWMWRWPRRGHNGDAAARPKQEALLRTAEKMTPLIERLADHVAELPAEEFASRVRDAFTLRST